MSDTAAAPLNLLALSGSFRAKSLNTAALRALTDIAAAQDDTTTITIYDYRDVPFYNGDLDQPIDAVERLKAAITQADGVILATPEYNYSVPGTLKNAIDWASRPAYKSPFYGKPTTVLGATPSAAGTARAQAHLKTILLGMGSEVFPYPEILIARAHRLFDADGNLSDDTTTEFLTNYLSAFSAWTRARRASR